MKWRSSRRQRDIISAHSPYQLREDGALLDRNGIVLIWIHAPNQGPCDWDRAVVAILNDVAMDAKR